MYIYTNISSLHCTVSTDFPDSLSPHLFLSSITSGKSSRLDPVSIQSNTR